MTIEYELFMREKLYWHGVWDCVHDGGYIGMMGIIMVRKHSVAPALADIDIRPSGDNADGTRPHNAYEVHESNLAFGDLERFYRFLETRLDMACNRAAAVMKTQL